MAKGKVADVTFKYDEETSYKIASRFLETTLRLAGIYFDPCGHRTVFDSKSRWRAVFNAVTSINLVFYLCLCTCWLGKSLPLLFKEEESTQTKLLVACLLILSLWIVVLGITMAAMLPRLVPQLLRKIDIVCSETIKCSTKHFGKITALYLIAGPISIIFAQKTMYIRTANQTVSTSDRIRTYPFPLESTAGQAVAFGYIYFGAVAANAFLMTACLMGILCRILGYEFNRITSNLEKMLEADPKSQDNELEKLRQQFERVCGLVTEADGFIKYSALIGFFFGVLVFCFALYCVTQGNLDAKDVNTITILMGGSVPQILEYTIFGSYLTDKAHSAKDILLKFSVTDLGDKGYRTFSLFLQRVSGPPIGITMFGTFTIDRTSTLTVFGTVLSYAVLVLQLSPSTPVTDGDGVMNGTSV